jgi:glucosamine-6-phosphate deaminase
MKPTIVTDSVELGFKTAQHAAVEINNAINKNGRARLLIATGASQFETIKHLVDSDIDWGKVEVFHLDEYVNLPEDHPASFRKYIRERFLAHVDVARFYPINTETSIEKTIQSLTEKVKERPIDVGLIGIGENGHIAFNDPPADFTTKHSYILVNLDEKCRSQQVNEGWFDSFDTVPQKAITMTAYQILQCRVIISAVPHLAKAKAVHQTLTNQVTNEIPATILQTHPNWHLYLDRDSASLLDPS